MPSLVIRRPQFVMLATVAISCASALGMVALPQIAKVRLGVSPAHLGAFGFVTSGVYVLSAWFAGRVSERVGRKRSLTWALGLMAGGYLLAIVAQHPLYFFIPYALTGLAAGTHWPVLEAAMNDGQSPRQMKRATVFFNTAWMGSQVVGSVLSGLLTQLGYGVPLAVAAALPLIVLYLLHRPGALDIRPWGSDAAFEHADRVPAVKRSLFVLMAYLGNAGAYFFIGAFRQLLPEYARTAHIDGWHYGVLVGAPTAGMLLTNWVLARWHGWHYSLRWFAGAQALLVALILSLTAIDRYGILLACAFCLGLPVGILYFSSIFYGMEQSSSLGAHSGNHESILGLGAALGPLLGGWAIAMTGEPRAYLVLSAAVFAIVMAVQLFLVGRRLGLTRRGRPTALLLVGLVGAWGLAGARPATAADPAWWRPEWEYRRRVRLLTPPRQSVQVAWLRFTIPEKCHPAGADVRVVDGQGNPCRMSLLFYDPALYGVVAFEIPDAQQECWLYQGNPAVSAPAAPWEPRAGVFLETARLNPGQGNNRMQDFLQSIAKPDPPYGAGFRPQVCDVFDPFGEPDRFVSRYTAWFHAYATGSLMFCTVSDEGSILRIDGKEVLRWRGSPRGNRILPEQTATVSLTQGIHKMEYLHYDWDGDQVAAAGWKKPNAAEFQVMPPDAFVPVRAAMGGHLESRGTPLAADFEVEPKDWLFTPRHSYFLYAFSDMSAGAAKVADEKWTFADGTTATGSTVEKLYFQRGDFPVTLSIKDAQGNQAEAKRTVRVLAQDKEERVTVETILENFAQFLKSHPLPDTADRPSCLAAAYLLESAGKLDDAVALYRRLADRPAADDKGQPDTEALTELLRLALNEMTAKPEETADCAARHIGALPATSNDKAALAIALGRLQLRRLKRPDDALATYRTALLNLPNNAAHQAREREALIGTGDAQRLMAQPAEAEEAYRKAQSLPPPAKVQDYDVSSFALTAEAYIRDKEYDEAQAVLDRWQEIYPLERLTGYASILQARILAGRGQPTAAIAELETFLGCVPRGVFAQTALEELAGLCEQTGAQDKARQSYERILAEFQDPAVRERAQTHLESLGTKPASNPAPSGEEGKETPGAAKVNRLKRR